MVAIAIPISLTHQRFRAIVLAFNEAIGNTRRQKVKERQDFLSPIPKRREGFSQVIETALLHLLDPVV